RKQGCRIILATASHWFYARKVADYLGLFDEVIATHAKYNLKGVRKLEKIRERVKGEPFAYAGDSSADRPIWSAAAADIHVNSAKSEIALSVSSGKLEKTIQTRPNAVKAFIRNMRVHQYVKNALIVVPLVTSHSYGDLASIFAVFWAVVCFSLCASGVYFLNDLLDLAADRQHATKRNRPLAAGDLSLKAGAFGAVGLPLLAFIIALLLLPVSYIAVLAGYYLITNAYSFYLKSIPTADVMALAVLYTLRVIAGATVLNIVPSSWLLAFSVFIFVSLAYLKRYIEVSAMSHTTENARGRGYSYGDRESLFVLGASNSTISVLVFALYISSPAVSVYYPNPEVLWLLCLLMLYWTNRLWVEARRGKIHDDPVVFALKDTASRVVLLAFAVIILVARFF
ncbi:MAG TPA: UbiA family prenyltransferase, partial [Gammaproteobacteria bacterium]|nr:UbiA family prenyltransferase [Gammaproteobacteria bacterium]